MGRTLPVGSHPAPRDSGGSRPVGDAWRACGATERLRLGPMITPIAASADQTRSRDRDRRRHVEGRLTLGFGLGVDTSGELSKFDEVVDPRIRGEMLDEGVPVLPRFLPGRRCSIAASTLSLTTCSSDLDRHRATAHPSGLRPWRRPQAAPKGEPLRGLPARHERRPLRPAHRDRRRERRPRWLRHRLSTTPGEPVADYAETATWAIHAWPALPNPDAVFEIVTTGPPD